MDGACVTDHPMADEPTPPPSHAPAPQARLGPQGRPGGLAAFIHTLAAILARLDEPPGDAVSSPAPRVAEHPPEEES